MLVLGGSTSLDPRYHPRLKAPTQSSGLTHGTFQSFVSQHATAGNMASRATDYRAPKRAREDDSETLVAKQLHTDSATRDVSQLLHQHGINIRPAEPEPEPQRAASAARIAMPAAVRASCIRLLNARC
eukprot:COSAG02_NODE_4687_length_5092_cov_2.075506_5_plen_128_part_00